MKRHHLLRLFIAVSLALTGTARAVVDNYQDSPINTDTTFQGFFTPTGYTTQAGEPTHSPTAPATSQSGWWLWRAPATGLLIIENAAIDQSYGICTAVYTSPGTWNLIGRTDSVAVADPTAPDFRIARMTVPVVKDEFYYIVSAARTSDAPSPAASQRINWNFVPFNAQGYVGLIDGTEQMPKGIIRLETSKTGSWSGYIEMAGRRHALRGTIGAGGKSYAAVSLRRLPGAPEEPPTILYLYFGSIANAKVVSVKLEFATVERIALLWPTQRYRSDAPSPRQGRYSLISVGNSTLFSDWPGLLEVKASGAYRLVTYLSDGDVITCSGQACPALNEHIDLVIAYKSRFDGRGFFSAELYPKSDSVPPSVTGAIQAQRPPKPGSTLLPEGYRILSNAVGSLYVPPTTNEWVHSDFGTTGGAAVFIFSPPVPSSQGTPGFVQFATLQLNGKFLFSGPNDNDVRAAFDRKTGMITGSYRSTLHPGKRLPFRLAFINFTGISPGFYGFLKEPHHPGQATLLPAP